MYERLLTWILKPAFAIFSMVASCKLPLGNPKRNFFFPVFFIYFRIPWNSHGSGIVREAGIDGKTVMRTICSGWPNKLPAPLMSGEPDYWTFTR